MKPLIPLLIALIIKSKQEELRQLLRAIDNDFKLSLEKQKADLIEVKEMLQSFPDQEENIQRVDCRLDAIENLLEN